MQAAINREHECSCSAVLLALLDSWLMEVTILHKSVSDFLVGNPALQAVIDREHEFRFLAVQPLPLDAKSSAAAESTAQPAAQQDTLAVSLKRVCNNAHLTVHRLWSLGRHEQKWNPAGPVCRVCSDFVSSPCR